MTEKCGQKMPNEKSGRGPNQNAISRDWREGRRQEGRERKGEEFELHFNRGCPFACPGGLSIAGVKIITQSQPLHSNYFDKVKGRKKLMK